MKFLCSNWPKLKKLWAAKTFRTMRLTLYALILAVVQGYALSGYAQATKLNLTMENSAVKEVLLEIENLSEFRFLYNSKMVDVDRTVSVEFNDLTIDKALNRLFKGSDAAWQIVDRQVVLFSKHEPVYETVDLQQQPAVSGKVTDSGGQPLPGVTVVVKGTTQGTVTNTDGNYSIANIPNDATLVFSFVGMRTQEVEVGSQTLIDIAMEEETIGMDEVVVIGYGIQKKVNLTAAVQMIDTKELENRPVQSITNMLSTSVPNLNILVGSSAPGEEPNLNIRGFTGFNSRGEPLILVDGVPQDIKFVNPQDVESISVLKDAAASAIYGSRAPNGVILITTKSGKRDQRMRIDVTSSVWFDQPVGLPNQVSGYDFMIYGRNMRNYNSGQAPLFGPDAIERAKQFMNGEISTTNIITPAGKYGGVWDFNSTSDRYGDAFKDFAMNQRYNINISGGDQKTSYFGSIGVIDREGNYESDHDWLKRYLTVFKVNTDITDWLNVGMNANYNRQETMRPVVAAGGVNDQNLFTFLAFNPHIPDFNDNGAANEFAILPMLDGRSGTFNNLQDDLWIKYNVNFTPLQGLSIKADYAWNLRKGDDNNVLLQFFSMDADGTTMGHRRAPRQDQVTKIRNTTNYHNFNANVTFEKMFGNHDFLILTGYNQEAYHFNGLTGRNTDLYTHSIQSLSTTYGDNAFSTDNIDEWATRGYFFRVSYNYNSIYLLDFNSRYDASSKYSPESRWAFFPSVSIGYNIAREKFWPLNNFIENFKFKGSWGNLGNNTGSSYAYLATMGSFAQTPVLLDGGRLPYVTMPGIISDDLTWTKPRVIGLGLETSAFNQKLSVEYDWYQRTVFDQQGPAEQYSEVLGTSAPQRNNAVSETRGWEFTVSWRDKLLNIDGSPVNYGIRAGLADYIGYVVEYVSNESGVRNFWTPGQVFGEVYGYKSLGIAQTLEDLTTSPLWRNGWIYQGDLLFADTNNDGVVNQGQGDYWYAQGDRNLLGYSYPRYSYHFSINAGWKGFTIFALFDGTGKQVRYFANEFNIGEQVFMTQEQLDRGYWTITNQDAFYPRAYHLRANQLFENQVNDQYLMNLAHLRIKNLNINYDVPVTLANKVKLSSLSINFSVENAGMVFYKNWFKEMDPIQVTNGGNVYPPSRSYALSLKFGI
jgi:TonB-linked SusC/RagA family outer membrane protein